MHPLDRAVERPLLIMNGKIRIEINARDEFWRKAVIVEWEDQYPERKLTAEQGGRYLIDAAFLDDLKRIAGDCFSEVVIAPPDPSRRALLRRFIPNGTENREKQNR
jgi:hypothetical protein